MKDWLDNQRKSAAAQVKSAEKAVPDKWKKYWWEKICKNSQKIKSIESYLQ